MELANDKDTNLRLVKFFIRALYGSCPVSLECLARLQNAYSSSVMLGSTSRISFDTEEMRSAYVHKYGPCFAGAVADHVRQVVGKTGMDARSFTVSCLGGGPAVEATGFAIAVDEFFKERRDLGGGRMTIKVLIIDIEPGWEQTAGKIVNSLHELVPSASVDFEFNFVQQDIMKPFSKECKDALRSSDFIMLVKVMSAIYGAHQVVDSTTMIQEILDCISEAAVLFLLDSTGFRQYHQIKERIHASESMELIYEMLQTVHFISLESLIYRIYAFSTDLLGERSSNNVHAWRRQRSRHLQIPETDPEDPI